MNEKKLKLLIKRQRSLRTYIDCKSKLELKMNENQRKNQNFQEIRVLILIKNYLQSLK